MAGALALAALFPTAGMAAFPGTNGRIAYAQTPPGELVPQVFTVLPNGSDVQQLTDGPGSYGTPSWSADGRRLVVGGSEGIFTMAADGSGQRRVTTTLRSRPSFSPSGERIAYAAARSIRTIGVDGTDSRRIVAGRLDAPTYSPSGKRIAFVGKVRGKKNPGVWSVRPDGSRLRRLAKGGSVFDLDYSPQGRHVAFTRSSDLCCKPIRVVRTDGSRERGIPNTAFATEPAYAPAGDRIAVALLGGPPRPPPCIDVYTIALDGSNQRRVTQNCELGLGPQAASPSWQPLPAE